MKPITRIEKYLAVIVSDDDATGLPTSPVRRVEYYLAKIAGEDVQIPQPVTRIEKYLANIAGENVEIPTPVTRAEKFLYAIAGGDVETPYPITRVEKYLDAWANPASILKTVTGNPIHILDALAKPAQALSVKLEPIQAGSGDPSPDNVRPISGHTSADVTRTGKNMANPSDFDITQPPYYPGQYWLGLSANADGTFTLTRPIGWGGNGMVYIGTFKAGTYNISFDVIDTADVVCAAYITVVKSGTWENLTSYAWSGNITEEGRYDHSVTFADAADIWLSVGPWTSNGAQVISGNCQVSLSDGAFVPYVGTTYPIPLGQTVYGGTLDVVTGVLTVDRGIADLGNLNWTLDSRYENNQFYVSMTGVNKNGEVLCSLYKPTEQTWSSNENYTIGFISTGAYLICVDDNYSTAAEFKTAVTGQTLVYELATPQTIQLTPQQVELLLGENNIFSDGEMTLVYLADGNASDAEALNILLGGRYVNNHGEDEPTDREALDILLGGR